MDNGFVVSIDVIDVVILLKVNNLDDLKVFVVLIVNFVSLNYY